MASILWIVCLTLFLVVVQAEAWLPAGFTVVKFKQSLRRNKLRQQSSTKDAVENEGQDVTTDEKQVENEETTEEAERKRLSLLPWWEDSWSEAFVNTFPLSPSSVLNVPALTSNNPVPHQRVEDELAHYKTPTPNPSARVLHFCFLLHGHRGFSTDLSYLQRVMQHQAELEKREREQIPTCTSQDMVVHCATCNEGKTMDGVVNGGERMVQEILQVIREELERRKQETSKDGDHIQDITISIVGNSLGGIYGRYAIARLVQKAADEENDPELTSCPCSREDEADESAFPTCVLLDGKYRLHFNIFCTTATPHLGISKHTYVPLPRSVEVGAAHVLGDTGRDLFRLNDLMKTMATCPTFLEPLRSFRKRVAYANAYATDFPVPATTAAFLSDQSTYPHHFASDNATRVESGDNEGSTPNQRHVVATLHTHASKSLPPFPGPDEEAIVDDLVQMSNSLDSLGWKKVFIDVRKEIPLRVALPRSMNLRKSLEKSSLGKTLLSTPTRLLRKGSGFSDESSTGVDLVATVDKDAGISLAPTPQQSSASPSAVDDGSDLDASDDDKPPVSAIHRLREKGVVESRDVASVVSTPDDMSLSFPLGHNLMVALDRNGITGGIYKGGRPVMDSLAKELVHDIFDWNLEEENEVVAQETLRLSEQAMAS